MRIATTGKAWIVTRFPRVAMVRTGLAMTEVGRFVRNGFAMTKKKACQIAKIFGYKGPNQSSLAIGDISRSGWLPLKEILERRPHGFFVDFKQMRRHFHRNRSQITIPLRCCMTLSIF